MHPFTVPSFSDSLNVICDRRGALSGNHLSYGFGFVLQKNKVGGWRTEALCFLEGSASSSWRKSSFRVVNGREWWSSVALLLTFFSLGN